MAANAGKNYTRWINKIVIFLAVVILLGIVTAIVKEIQKKRQVTQEIDKLRQEAQRIEKENENLSDKIRYLESTDFKEKEARDKLGLKAGGENVIVIRPSPLTDTEKNDLSLEKREADIIIRQPNIAKWWDYFFKY